MRVPKLKQKQMYDKNIEFTFNIVSNDVAVAMYARLNWNRNEI